MLKSNKHYFDLSVRCPEGLDSRYMFLEWDKDIEKYVSATKKLKELLATIKTLGTRTPDDIYENLFDLAVSKFASKSELNCFINACDSTTSTIKNDRYSFKQIVNLYLKHRDFTEITPKEWIQAIIDKGASRAKGCTGENKLVEIADSAGFAVARNWGELLRLDKAIARFSKGIFDLLGVKKHLGVNFDFKSQNKMLDLIIKSGGKYIIIEAKHLKEGGGSQDKQIKELIGIIQHRKVSDDIMLGAFCDGVYSNVLLNEDVKCNAKITTQQKDIAKALKNNQNSFWFNTAGFSEFIKDF
jgi:Holliday junction resolvase